jgi:hypothetical protein
MGHFNKTSRLPNCNVKYVSIEDEKVWDTHCKGLYTLEKYEIACLKGS